MRTKAQKLALFNAAAQVATNCYSRTRNMLPMPPLRWTDVLHACMTDEQITASRLVASFHEHDEKSGFKLKFTYGVGWVDAHIHQPDEEMLFLPNKGRGGHLDFNLMNEEPPEWAQPFATWVKQTTDIYIDCKNLALTLDALGQRFTMSEIKLLWPDLPLIAEVQTKDTFVTQATSMCLAEFRAAPLPKKPMLAFWPGMKEDIERARGTIGRALLGEPEPREHPIAIGGNWRMPKTYRQVVDAVLHEVVTVSKRADVKPMRHYGVT